MERQSASSLGCGGLERAGTAGHLGLAGASNRVATARGGPFPVTFYCGWMALLRGNLHSSNLPTEVATLFFFFFFY